MILKNKDGVVFNHGDIFDIHQTVNGFDHFVIVADGSERGYHVRYYNESICQIGRKYEYDLDELLDLKDSTYDDKIVVVKNIASHVDFHIAIEH